MGWNGQQENDINEWKWQRLEIWYHIFSDAISRDSYLTFPGRLRILPAWVHVGSVIVASRFGIEGNIAILYVGISFM